MSNNTFEIAPSALYGSTDILAGGKHVARVYGPQDGGTEDHAANARLMAAAPDLLRALKAVDTKAKDANRNGDVIIPSEIFDLVQQAIAKAEGK